jgi:acyl-homoserine lactone acylase PvdQ
MLNEDYREMLQALVDEKARFLLVGAYALAAHGYPRAAMDIDIWVMPSPANAAAVLRALRRFGAPLQNLTKADLEKNGTVFQIGVAPRRH